MLESNAGVSVYRANICFLEFPKGAAGQSQQKVDCRRSMVPGYNPKNDGGMGLSVGTMMERFASDQRVARMYKGTDPLIFPPHFPPTDRWKKFFIGVRWLGPDLSFFKQLRHQQAERTREQMLVWGSGKQREIADQLAQGFQKELRWPNAVFLPGDSFQVICNGPAFGTIDDFGADTVIQKFEKHYGIRVPTSFWVGKERASFGEIVEALERLLAASPP
jgi:hypothetical protein